jgi:hypothetical protein
VVFCHFNPQNYRRPKWNLNAFLTALYAVSVPCYAVELSFDGQYELPDNGRVLKLAGKRPDHVLFQKEALWNAAEKIVPAGVDQLVFLDADVVLSNPNWPRDLAEGLERFRFMAPFSHSVWTNEYGDEIYGRPSTIWAKLYHSQTKALNFSLAHPGFGVAMRRSAFWKMGGFWPSGVTGAGDAHLMHAVCGLWDRSPLRGQMPESVLKSMDAYSGRVHAAIEGKIGVVPGECRHLWHGSRENRQYCQRHKLLEGHDPDADLQVEPSGLVKWSQAGLAKTRIVEGMAAYFAARKEDGV